MPVSIGELVQDCCSQKGLLIGHWYVRCGVRVAVELFDAVPQQSVLTRCSLERVRAKVAFSFQAAFLQKLTGAGCMV